MRRKFLIATLLASATVAACSGGNEFSFSKRSSPDEFMVRPRAPLTLPPDYELRAPSGDLRQEYAPSTAERQAREALGDTGTSELTPAELAILKQAGADKVSGNIRAEIDRETAALEERNLSVLERALGRKGRITETVDVEAERARIQKNIEEGKPISEGEVPVKQPDQGGLF